MVEVLHRQPRAIRPPSARSRRSGRRNGHRAPTPTPRTSSSALPSQLWLHGDNGVDAELLDVIAQPLAKRGRSAVIDSGTFGPQPPLRSALSPTGRGAASWRCQRRDVTSAALSTSSTRHSPGIRSASAPPGAAELVAEHPHGRNRWRIIGPSLTAVRVGLPPRHPNRRNTRPANSAATRPYADPAFPRRHDEDANADVGKPDQLGHRHRRATRLHRRRHARRHREPLPTDSVRSSARPRWLHRVTG